MCPDICRCWDPPVVFIIWYLQKPATISYRGGAETSPSTLSTLAAADTGTAGEILPTRQVDAYRPTQRQQPPRKAMRDAPLPRARVASSASSDISSRLIILRRSHRAEEEELLSWTEEQLTLYTPAGCCVEMNARFSKSSLSLQLEFWSSGGRSRKPNLAIERKLHALCFRSFVHQCMAGGFFRKPSRARLGMIHHPRVHAKTASRAESGAIIVESLTSFTVKSSLSIAIRAARGKWIRSRCFSRNSCGIYS